MSWVTRRPSGNSMLRNVAILGHVKGSTSAGRSLTTAATLPGCGSTACDVKTFACEASACGSDERDGHFNNPIIFSFVADARAHCIGVGEWRRSFDVEGAHADGSMRKR